ncbi:MAG: orotidine-5'-phosphate decarboxylase [Patescibacteria group bacterium]
MMTKHNFVELAEIQKEQKTSYCAGLDVHPFGSYSDNINVYGSVIQTADELKAGKVARDWYRSILNLLTHKVISMNQNDDFSYLLSCIECYLIRVIDILVNFCNIRVFKPQVAFYEQFGPSGMFLLSRINQYIKALAREKGIRLIVILDCKRGDIDTTQAAYLTGLLGNLKDHWGIDYSPFDFDIINVTPWMGRDVLVLGGVEKPGLGLKLMQQGKGIIAVNKTSNPSGPDYQELHTLGTDGSTLQMLNVSDMYNISQSYDLEYDGLSSIGLVVGSTHQCDGGIRLAFPSTTLLVPGFGAQGGKFSLIMPELIRTEKWNGQGAIFSSSRGTMYPWMEKLGGSGKVHNLETDLINAITQFRVNEKAAYETKEVQEMGIIYPFAA